MQRAKNGNGVPETICFQNIPGKCGPDRVGDIITDILDKYRPLILFIAEARADVVASKTPHGYNHYPGTLKYRKNPRMSMLIKAGVNYKIEELKLDVPTACVNIEGWRILGYYREWNRDGYLNTDHPDDQFERLDGFVKTLKKFKKKGKCLAMGDTNVDLYNIYSDYQKKWDEMRNLLEDGLIANGWLQMIREVTRSQQGQTSSCLDHIFVTHFTYVESVENENVSGTDHNCVSANLQFDKPVFTPQTFNYRNIDGIQEQAYEDEFLRGKIWEVYKCREVDLCLDILEFKILRPLNKLAPEKQITTRENHAPWMTSDLKKEVRKRDKMRKEALREKDKEKRKKAWEKFKEFRDQLSKKKITAKLNYYREDLQTGTCKEKWAKVQRLSKYQSRKKGAKVTGSMEIEDETGRKIEDPQVLTEFMNGFFKSKVTKLQAGLNPDPKVSGEYCQEYLQEKELPRAPGRCFRPARRREIKKILKKLNNTGAMGRDKIPTKVLKRYRGVIGPPLTHLVNLCLQKRKYPSGWKIGLIRPLSKGGDLTKARNWRPIVLNCVMSKVLEQFINQQLMSHMENWRLFSNSQHAYRHHRSVSSALQDLNTIQADLRNRGKVVCVLTTDVSAGFNLVTKEILVPKMAQYGFDSSACDILRDYLTNRKTKTVINGFISQEISLESGVGEGSCLGPTYFSCGMACISIVAKRTEKRLKDEYDVIGVECFTDEFADDATGILGASSEEDLQLAINVMLEEFLKYYSANGLALNVEKCQILIHRVKPKVQDLFCGPPASQYGPPTEDMKEKRVMRLLGLMIDADLKFDTHCQKVIGQCYTKLGAMQRLVGILPREEVIQVTEALIISQVDWCAEIWLRSPKNQVKVQRLLNSVMRVINKVTLKDKIRVSELLKSCNWLNATNICRRAQVCNLRRILYKQVAPFSFALCNVKVDARHYAFRQNRGVRCGWGRLTRFVRNSFLLESIDLYNHMKFGTEFIEDEEFRDVVTDRLIKEFGNANL